MKKYNFTFVNNMIEKFNLYRRKDTKKRDMNVLEGLIYIANINGNGFQKSIDEILHFLNFNNRKFKRKKISKSGLHSAIKRLEKNKLIELSKNTKGLSYKILEFNSLFDIGENTKLNTKLNKNEVSQTVDISEIEDDNNRHKETQENNIYIDFINTTHVAFGADQYKKCNCWEDVKEELENAFKFAKIRSRKIKADVITKIERNLTNITKKFAFNYIYKVVLQVQEHYKMLRSKYVNAMYNNKTKNLFCDYEQREYNYKELEKQLLGY